MESIFAHSTRIVCTAFIAVSYVTKYTPISISSGIILTCIEILTNTAKVVGSAGSAPVYLTENTFIIVEGIIVDAFVAFVSYFAVVTLTDVTRQTCPLVIKKAG